MGLLTALRDITHLSRGASASNLVAKLHRWMNLFPQQASDALLELVVLSGVDERVDDAVDLHHHYGEVVKPAQHHGEVVEPAKHHGKVVEPAREVEREHADGTQEE